MPAKRQTITSEVIDGVPSGAQDAASSSPRAPSGSDRNPPPVRLSLILVYALAAACAPAPSPTSLPSPAASASSSPSPSVTFPSASAVPPRASTSVPTLEAERRAILAELVSFDTSHGHETDALGPIARRFEEVGVHADIFEAGPGRGNLVARIKGSGASKPLLLMAHIDVVAGE